MSVAVLVVGVGTVLIVVIEAISVASKLSFPGPSCIAINLVDVFAALSPERQYAAISRTASQHEVRPMILISEERLV